MGLVGWIRPNNTCSSSSTYTIPSLSVANVLVKWEVSVNNAYASYIHSGLGLNEITINWLYPNLLPDEFTITVTVNPDCPSAILTKKIYKCCFTSQPSNQQLFNQTISNATISGEKYVMGNLIIDNNVTVTPGSIWHMGPMSKVIVNPNKELTLIGNITISQGCNYMWDGIYVEGATQKLTINSNQTGVVTISDAINAVYSSKGGKFFIDNALFSNNYIGIKIVDYYQGIWGYSNPYPGHVFGTTFTNNKSPGYLINLQPYMTEPSNSGIYIERVNGINIGSGSHNINNFSNLKSGIYAINSNCRIYNNEFTSIPPVTQPPIWPPQNAAVFAKCLPVSNLGFVSFVAVGEDFPNSPLQSSNQFRDCYYGIHIRKQKSDLINNKFRNCSNSIHCLESGDAKIFKNIIFSENTPVDMAGTAIKVEDPISPSEHSPRDIQINQNIITGIQNGISVTNEVGYKNANVRILDNEIYFANNLGKTAYRTGINVIFSEYCQIERNHIEKEGTATPASQKQYYRGIRIDRSCNGWVSDNYVTNFGYGIQTNGELLNTVFPCNVFDNCFHGIWIGEGTTLTDQIPGDEWNTKNHWIGHYTSTNYKICTDPLTNLTNFNQITWNEYTQYLPSFRLDDDLWIASSGHPLYTFIIQKPCSDFDHCTDFLHPKDSITDTTTREKYFGAIIRDDHHYEQFDPQYHSWEKSYFYRHVLRDTTLIYLGGRDDSAYQVLYDSLRIHNPGLLDLFRLNVAQRNYNLAKNINNSLDINRLWDNCSYDVNDIFLRKWVNEDYEYSQNDSARLMEIALLTPYEGGEAVYTARIMLNLDYETLGTPYSSPIVNEDKTEANKIKILPNPAKDHLSLCYTGEENIADVIFELYFINGQIVMQKEIILNPGETQIDLDMLPSGMYFYQVKANSVSIGKGKLCVIR